MSDPRVNVLAAAREAAITDSLAMLVVQGVPDVLVGLSRASAKMLAGEARIADDVAIREAGGAVLDAGQVAKVRALIEAADRVLDREPGAPKLLGNAFAKFTPDDLARLGITEPTP